MFHGQVVSVLAVATEAPGSRTEGDGLEVVSAASARQATEWLQSRRFDLLLTGTSLPDVSIWEFIRRTRVTWPWVKWVMAGHAISEQQVMTAKMFSAVAILEAPARVDELLELSRHVQRVAAAAVLDRGLK